MDYTAKLHSITRNPTGLFQAMQSSTRATQGYTCHMRLQGVGYRVTITWTTEGHTWIHMRGYIIICPTFSQVPSGIAINKP